MAGHRHGSEEPAGLQRHGRQARRRARMAARLALAEGPRGRLDVAYDALRGAAARRQPDQDRADEIVDDAVRALLTAFDQLLERQAGEGRWAPGRAS